MAEYRGQITLINVNDGNAAEGVVGIVSVNTYYAPSVTSNMPPDEELYNLILESGVLQLEPNRGVNLYFKDGVLLASRNGEELNLVVDNSIIIGAGGNWTETMPEIEQDSYIWSKTATTYTDNSAHVVYSVSRIGADGQQGPKGEPGDPGDAGYKIKSNQKEILKFADEEGNISLSPETLTFSIYKDDPSLESGEIQLLEGLSVNNLKLSIYNRNGGIWSQASNNFASLSAGTFQIDLNVAINGDSIFSEIFLDNETVIEISYLLNMQEDKYYNLTSYIDVRFGMSKDMASLSVNANGIVAAMQDSKMTFDGSGLTVKNGAFKIVNEKDENQLYADQEGNLVLKGKVFATGGKFTGELEATSGSFKGELTADSGTIGGFNIEEGLLSSTVGNSQIILDGANASIKADNITLGSNAKIEGIVQIGDFVKIKTPEYDGDSFISVINTEQSGYEILSLNSDGTLNIGYEDNMIVINGKDGSIKSRNYDTGIGWKITNKDSIFNNVSIRGSIRASVLEYGEIQAIGGALIVRPSSRILNYTNNDIGEGVYTTTLTLESTTGFQIGDWCRIEKDLTNKMFFQIIEIEEETIIVNGSTDDVRGCTIVDFGHTKDGVRAIGIGINGSIDDSLIVPNALSVFEFNDELHTTIPRIILGKLPDDYGSVGGSYGLYAENVFLRGSLVTQTMGQNSNISTYSGISTLFSEDAPNSSQTEAGAFFEKTGEILLWAGAPKEDRVQEAKFFVDKHGNLFAGSGYFKGTIITNATIEASEIKTTVLTGSGDSPALTIKDATKGIVFTADDQTVLEVSKDKVSINAPVFQLNNDFKIGESGSIIVPNLYVVGEKRSRASSETTTQSLMFSNSCLSYTENFNEKDQSGLELRRIDFSNDIKFISEEKEMLKITSQETQIKSDLTLSGIVTFGTSVKYVPVEDDSSNVIGYDLYID